MTALSDALAAAQARALSALAKSYVTSSPEDDDAMQSQKELVRATLDEIGCRDSVEQDQWLAALDVLRAAGANVPAEQRTNGAKPEDEKATDAQWKLIKRLCDERSVPYPSEPITKAQAHEIIDTLKAGSYDADKWSVPF